MSRKKTDILSPNQEHINMSTVSPDAELITEGSNMYWLPNNYIIPSKIAPEIEDEIILSIL
jgi:hypothetical protein